MIVKSFAIASKIKTSYYRKLVHHLNWLRGRREVLSRELSKDFAVTLATYPKRLKFLELTLQSLILQQWSESVAIYVVHEEYDTKSYSKIAKKYAKYNVYFISNNKSLRSYNKYHIASQEATCNIGFITADDDINYPRNWLMTLIELHRLHPSYIVGLRGVEVPGSGSEMRKYLNWKPIQGEITGRRVMLNSGAGILFPPKILKDFLSDEMTIVEKFGTSDDIYLWYFLYKNGFEFICSHSHEIVNWPKSQKQSLWKINVGEKQNDLAIANLLKILPSLVEE